MGFRELLQVMGAFELQHGFSPGNKKPAEAGYEGDDIESFGGFFRGYLKGGFR